METEYSDIKQHKIKVKETDEHRNPLGHYYKQSRESFGKVVPSI